MRHNLAGSYWAVAAVVILATARFATAQRIDLNTNGMSEVWELLYEAGSLPPNGDADGDGASNLAECLAGTNPFDPNSSPRVTWISHQKTNVALTILGAAGKHYELQSLPALGSNWITEASQSPAASGPITLNAPATEAPRFFRVAVSDLDSDEDGLSDWEEIQLGLDPHNANSNQQLDQNGTPINDYAYASSRLQDQNRISLTALDATADQPDPGQPAVNLGQLLITRAGFPLNSVTVNLEVNGPGVGMATEGLDHEAVARTVVLPAGVNSASVWITPLANTNRTGPVVATLRLLPGAKYMVGSSSNASILIFPSATPTGTGLTGQYYTNASATYASSANFSPANLRLTRTDAAVDFTWGNTTNPIPNNGWYTIRWTGQVQPQYSETYYFVANTDDGVRLWVNDQLIIDNWVTRSPADSTGKIDLQGGVRYNIKLEYFQATGGAVAKLSWYSPSQAKQTIPSNRLYPASVMPGPSSITCSLNTVGFLGQTFTFTVTGANTPTSVTASNLPPGLMFNPVTRLISGTPLLAGTFQVMLTSSNATGLGASVLSIDILDTGSAVSRELWTGVAGVSIADLPAATSTTNVSAWGGLEGVADFGEDYAERIRGYITAPVTGNYYFWLAASDSAELWISNDNEPANKVRRAWVLPNPNPAPPPANGSAPRQWNLQPNQRSPWLALVAGRKYYLEILHKAGTGIGDNWAVGWRQDPTGTNNTPSEIVPPYVLSRYFPLPIAYLPGTLYTASLLPQPGTVSKGVGFATLRLSADESVATLKFSASGLSSPVTGEHIHSDPYLSQSGQIIFDIDQAPAKADGSRDWTIGPVGTLSGAEVLEIIKQGKAYINIHTVTYPGGEIKGYFSQGTQSKTFTPPPAPPTWTDDHTSSNAASRFLIQATFGPTAAEIASVQALGYDGWISNQFSLSSTYHLPYVLNNRNYDPTTPYPGTLVFNAWWQRSVTAPDQLRQRLAFALSEILVVSEAGILANNGRALSDYYDMLLDHALGNFRELLEAVTLHPAMGLYLDMRANDKGDLVTGRHANENYAREILQLFSIGLNRMWPDGTLVLDSGNTVIPTYDQDVIMGFASVFTGWNYWQQYQTNGRLPTSFSPSQNYTNAMVLVPTHHELGTKRLLDKVILPPAWGTQADPANTNFDSYCSQDLELALDNIFHHQNVGPFICRQLIQRLVKSHPSPDYVYRVVQRFNDNGAGVRGDMKAIIQAILLDYEARSPYMVTLPTHGKQREPLVRVAAAARAFASPPTAYGIYSQTGAPTITCSLTNAHRMNTGDTVLLSFADASGNPPPADGRYSVTVTSPSSFTVNDAALPSGTYIQVPNTTVSNAVTGAFVTTNAVFVSLTGHGLQPGNPVYLLATTGGASNAVYSVISATNNNNFVVATQDPTARSGNLRIHKLTGAYSQAGTTLTVLVNGAHSLNPGDPVYINFTSGNVADGTYTVVSNLSPSQWTVTVATSATQNQSSLIVLPLVAPLLVRSGNLIVQQSTWNVGNTDGALSQTPLRSPTVFNFFFPDYKFPGPLATAGLTTPEFQLTSDTEVANQMNFMADGTLRNTGNTNGLSSFSSGDGDMVLDIGPWLSTNYTAGATAIGSLVDALNTLLVGGQLSASAKTAIVNYASNNSNLPYSTPPTSTQIRDRVRAVVHLILVSPDYTIQR